MKKIGITGGIGSGKSVVADLLKIMGIPVYIADTESKKLTNSLPELKEKLCRLFGNDLYQTGTLNKSYLSSLIFKNKKNLEKVNSIIHPYVLNDFQNWAENQALSIIAIESAILFESGFDKYTDEIWTVYAPLDARINRVIKRESTTRESVMERIRSQLPDEEKCKRSDFIIYNDEIKAIIPQVERLLF